MSTEKKTSATDAIVSILLALPVSIWAAWVEKTLWYWFAVPLGLPAIGMAHAYGLSALLVCITGGISAALFRKNDDTSPSTRMVALAIGFAICLGCAWVAHKFMATP